MLVHKKKTYSRPLEAYPVHVLDDIVLLGCSIILLLQVKENINRQLFFLQRNPGYIFWDSPGGLRCDSSWSRTGFYNTGNMGFFKVPNESVVNHAVQYLAQAAGQRDWSVTECVSVPSLVWGVERGHSCCSSLMRIVSCGPEVRIS